MFKKTVLFIFMVKEELIVLSVSTKIWSRNCF